MVTLPHLTWSWDAHGPGPVVVHVGHLVSHPLWAYDRSHLIVTASAGDGHIASPDMELGRVWSRASCRTCGSSCKPSSACGLGLLIVQILLLLCLQGGTIYIYNNNNNRTVACGHTIEVT